MQVWYYGHQHVLDEVHEGDHESAPKWSVKRTQGTAVETADWRRENTLGDLKLN